MKAAILFRITAVVFLIFAAGHTWEFLSFHAPTQQAQAVYEGMNAVHFEAGHKILSYGGWYRGFGLSATAALLFEAFLAWYLGGMAQRGVPEVKALGWGLFVWQIPGVALAWRYFGIAPMVLAIVVALLIFLATFLATTSPTTTKAVTGMR